MIERRRMPRPALPLTKVPASSGPRCTMASHIRTIDAGSTESAVLPLTIPAMPHIILYPRAEREARRSRSNSQCTSGAGERTSEKFCSGRRILVLAGEGAPIVVRSGTVTRQHVSAIGWAGRNALRLTGRSGSAFFTFGPHDLHETLIAGRIARNLYFEYLCDVAVLGKTFLVR